MYKYRKTSPELTNFTSVFSNYITIKTVSIGFLVVSFLVLAVFGTMFVFSNSECGEAKDAQSSALLSIAKQNGDIVSVPATETCYWECNPLNMNCYTNWDSLGPNQFSLIVSTSLGWATGLANCESPGLCDPGNYDIRGRRVKGVPGDSHGYCTIIYQGYWAEGGIGYHHWSVNNYNSRTTENYQNWSGSFKTPAYGGIYMDKISTWDWTLTNPYYSLEGCVYYIYNNLSDATNRVNAVSKIVLQEDGHGVCANNFYAEQTYYVRESNLPGEHGKGYKINEDIGVVKIQHDTNTSITWSGGSVITKDEPVLSDALISIQKTDTQTGTEGITEGCAPSFENAIYDFEYRNSPYTNEILHWQMATDEDGKVGISEKYRENKVAGDDFIEWNNKVVAPLGVYYIHEISAPDGYLVSNADYMAVIEPSDTSPTGTITTFKNIDSGEYLEQIIDPQTGTEKVKVLEQVIRGDYKFIKVNEEDEPLAGIPFKITSKSTGEWHIIVSDKNGIVDTSASHYLHSKNTNCNDSLYDNSTGKIVDENALTSNCGLWFGIDKTTGEISEADDNFGALPYDTYEIEEILISCNEKYQPFDKRTFIVEYDAYKIEGEKWINRVPKAPLPQTGDLPFCIIGLSVLVVLCYITRRWVYYRKY